mgnify:CR=1 FL=1
MTKLQGSFIWYELMTTDSAGAKAFYDAVVGWDIDAASASHFAATPNLILTPHIAGVTEESNVRVSAVTAQSVLRHLMT